MRNKMGILCMITGAVLIFSALFLLVYNRNENNKAGKASEEVVFEMKQEIMGRVEKPVSQTEELSMPEQVINGYAYIGYLTIPALNLELPVMSEWDYDRLKIAPCRQAGSIMSDDLVIAGHNYARHFGRLQKLVVGDVIVFTNMNGVQTEYSVGELETLNASQGEEMLYSDWDLTLYTCTYSGKSRITVRADKY